MATLARVAAVSVVAVLAGACSGPATPKAAAARTTETNVVAARAPQRAPLVLETGAPPTTPAIAFVVRSGTHDTVVPGHLYTADWSTAEYAALKRASEPVPWPKLATIAGGDNATIALGTPFVPDFLVIKVFTEVEPFRLSPIGMPIATFGCNRFTAPKCVVRTAKSGLRLLNLDQTVYTGTYLVVFGQWHLPASQRVAGSLSDTVTASWLFHIAHTRAATPAP